MIFGNILAIFFQIRPVFCTSVYLTMKYGISYGIPPEIPANFTFLRNVWHTAAAVTAAGGTLRELSLVYYLPLVVYITYRSKNRENITHIAAI